MKSMLKRFWNDEAGLELVEYAVMGGLIVLAIVGAITLLAGGVENKFNAMANTVEP